MPSSATFVLPFEFGRVDVSVTCASAGLSQSWLAGQVTVSVCIAT